MKKFLILVTVAVIATCLVGGCVEEVKTYTDSGQTIDIGVNQEFVIALGANPTTGYDWEVGEVKTYTDEGQTIDIGVNQEFIIAIGANPTTGYDWEVSLDETMLELVEKIYKLAEEAEHEIVGAGGVDYFRFKALKAGETEITMVYKRSWEEPTPQDVTKVFTVNLDETILELVEKTYKLAEEAEHEIVGAGGVDYFRFKALKAGETEITLVYKRSWEEEGIDQKVFTVNID
ncbi:hypothetical protein ES708_06092 [subsurface metagenome]